MAKPLPKKFLKKPAAAMKKRTGKNTPAIRVKKSNTPVRPPPGTPLKGGMLDGGGGDTSY